MLAIRWLSGVAVEMPSEFSCNLVITLFCTYTILNPCLVIYFVGPYRKWFLKKVKNIVKWKLGNNSTVNVIVPLPQNAIPASTQIIRNGERSDFVVSL